MSRTSAILEAACEETGWNDSSLVELLCEYIDHQQDVNTFADFIAQKVEGEKPYDDDEDESNL